MKWWIRSRWFRWFLLVPFMLLLTGGVVFGAYLLGSIAWDITTQEAITYSPQALVGTFYPNETLTETITLTNAGSVGIAVTVSFSVNPNDGGITVVGEGLSQQDSIVVPAQGSTTFDATAIAAPDVAPGVTYAVTIGLAR